MRDLLFRSQYLSVGLKAMPSRNEQPRAEQASIPASAITQLIGRGVPSANVFRAKSTGISQPNQSRHVQNLCRSQLSRFQSICDKGSLGIG
jgi:hypothetical protein